jgi:signal transduction histidine kinase
MQTLKNIIQYNRILLILLIGIILIQGLILYLILIRLTHKISGPIYVMSNYITEILNGMTPVIRPLRSGDQLKDFYDLLLKLFDKFKK